MRLTALIPRQIPFDRAVLARRAPAIGAAVGILFVAHLCVWFYLAHLAKARVERYLASHSDTISAKSVGSGGYPLHIEARLTDVSFHGLKTAPVAEASAPLVAVRSGAFSVRGYTIVFPDGVSLTMPALQTAAHYARITVSGVAADGTGGDVDVQIGGVSLGSTLPIATADSIGLRITRPPTPPDTDTAETARFSLDISAIRLAAKLGDLGTNVGDIHTAGTVNGRIAVEGGRAGLAAWRDNGGTIELPRVSVDWGKFSIAGEGTLALDKQLQPQAAFSATVDGWPDLIDALAASGAMKPTEARIVQLGLSLISPPGSGQSLKVPINLRDGQIYLEKAKIARIPPIEWPSG